MTMCPSVDFYHLPIAVLDLETTGLSSFHGDRICEIGLVLAQGGIISGTFSTLINPQRPISPGASRVNGISDELVQGAPFFTDVAQELLEKIEGRVIVCHNAPFDLGFLDNELSRLNLSYEQVMVIDTLDLARRYFHFSSNSLQSIAQTLDIEVGSAHRALGDALTTLSVFEYFVTVLEKAHDLSGLEIMNNHQPYRIQLTDNQLPPIIHEALVGRHEIVIDYMDGSANETHRIVTPLFVEQLSDYIYLRAFCHLRQQERTFRMDRIVGITLKDNHSLIEE
jgi:DNA polymerase-3 subunit epsilon